MVDFKKLRAQSGKASLQKLTAKVEEMQKEGVQKDDRFWAPTVDKGGNGYAVIRFLPEPEGEDVPFVRTWDHGFQGPGGWYIENSLTTIGQDDPCSEYNTKLWNTSQDDESSERQQARKQKRRLHYISNIYVIEDKANPDNEGKVFLFKYGKKIFNKLDEAMAPEFEDEQPFSPFDLWEGANFKLKIRKVEGYRNYDKSEFDKVGPLFKNDETLNKAFVGQEMYLLQEFLDPKNFKTYAELKAKLQKVLLETVDPVGNAGDDDINEAEKVAPKASKKRSGNTSKAKVEIEDEEAFFESLTTEKE
jgi:hypothetical protein